MVLLRLLWVHHWQKWFLDLCKNKLYNTSFKVDIWNKTEKEHNLAKDEHSADLGEGKSSVPLPSTGLSGRNFKLCGFGVSWVWMDKFRTVAHDNTHYGYNLWLFPCQLIRKVNVSCGIQDGFSLETCMAPKLGWCCTKLVLAQLGWKKPPDLSKELRNTTMSASEQPFLRQRACYWNNVITIGLAKAPNRIILQNNCLLFNCFKLKLNLQ